MVPGTYEYAERTAARPEISFHWLVPRMPVMNICKRHMPYFWSFDPTIPEEEWVRKFPDIAYEIPEQHIGFMVTHERFPPPEGKDLINVIGLRASESVNRRLAMFSSGGFLTYPDPHTKVKKARPIYDWNEPDVWLAIKKFQWDYNKAYDVFWQIGMKPSMLRIGPPTINIHSIKSVPYFAKAWPHWFDRVCHRLPGVRRVAQFGLRAVQPLHYPGETWEKTFHRECVEEAPEWIADRSLKVRDRVAADWKKLSTQVFPEIVPHHKMREMDHRAHSCRKLRFGILYCFKSR